MVGESLRGFGKNPRRCRAGGAFGRLEIVDVEWKVGKQRFLRVYIDKVPGGREAVKALGDRESGQHAEANGGD